MLLQGDNTALSMVTSRYALALQHEKGLALNSPVAAMRTACLTGVAQRKMADPIRGPSGNQLVLGAGDLDEAVSGLLTNGIVATDVSGTPVPSGSPGSSRFVPACSATSTIAISGSLTERICAVSGPREQNPGAPGPEDRTVEVPLRSPKMLSRRPYTEHPAGTLVEERATPAGAPAADVYLRATAPPRPEFSGPRPAASRHPHPGRAARRINRQSAQRTPDAARPAPARARDSSRC